MPRVPGGDGDCHARVGAAVTYPIMPRLDETEESPEPDPQAAPWLDCPACEKPALLAAWIVDDDEGAWRYEEGECGPCPHCAVPLRVAVSDDYEDDAVASLVEVTLEWRAWNKAKTEALEAANARIVAEGHLDQVRAQLASAFVMVNELVALERTARSTRDRAVAYHDRTEATRRSAEAAMARAQEESVRNDLIAQWSTLRPIATDPPDELAHVLFWHVPICEPPEAGSLSQDGLNLDWYTHWSPLPNVVDPSDTAAREGGGT